MKSTQSFNILHIPQNASMDDAKRAYKQLVKKWHPDQFADQPNQQMVAQEKLKVINVAFQEVSKIIKQKKKPKTTDIAASFKDLGNRKKTTPDKPFPSWQTVFSQFKKNLNGIKQFLDGGHAITSHRRKQPDRLRRNKGTENINKKSAPLNFEEVLQYSFQKRTGFSKSKDEKAPPDIHRRKTRDRLRASSSKNYGMRNRTRFRTKGRIEAIRPIDRIKGVGRIE